MANEKWEQVEKPVHLHYLKSFRTEECKDFATKRCNQHQPYTCFKWHFPNQRRRRPIWNAKDGTFNYSPDVYCKNYSDKTGTCPERDACPFLHRNIGDTEKRYHLRNFKVDRCVSGADKNGHCLRNGIHCAFAHSADEVREPIYETTSRSEDAGGANTVSRRENIVSENASEESSAESDDMRWNDREYLLQNYKTEPCRSKFRQCQPIIACCPYYHSARDRRRSPGIFPYKYRGVACSQVKVGDDWGLAEKCYRKDECIYSHTRVELQYHPEVYARVQCDNELQGNCRKGVFCAFAHSERPAEKKLNNGQRPSYSHLSNAGDSDQSQVAPEKGDKTKAWMNFSNLTLNSDVAASKFNPSLSSIFHSPSLESPFNSIDSAMYGSNIAPYGAGDGSEVAGAEQLGGDDVGLLDRFDSNDEDILDELIDDASLTAEFDLSSQHGQAYGRQVPPSENSNKNNSRQPPEWSGTNESLVYENMKRELERTKMVARSNFDDKIQAAKERDLALTTLSKMKDEMENQQARQTNSAAASVGSGDFEKMAFPVLQRKETQLRLDLIKLQEVMYRKANGKCIICLDSMAVDAMLPCRHRSVCNNCMHETDECPICHVSFTTK